VTPGLETPRGDHDRPGVNIVGDRMDLRNNRRIAACPDPVHVVDARRSFLPRSQAHSLDGGRRVLHLGDAGAAKDVRAEIDIFARKSGGMPCPRAEHGGETRSHALRGNAVFDAPRRPVPAEGRRAAREAFPRRAWERVPRFPF